MLKRRRLTPRLSLLAWLTWLYWINLTITTLVFASVSYTIQTNGGSPSTAYRWGFATSSSMFILIYVVSMFGRQYITSQFRCVLLQQTFVRKVGVPVLSCLIRILLATYLFIYVFAVPMLMLDLVPPWGIWMGGFLLLLQGALLGLWLIANVGVRGILVTSFIIISALVVEYIGIISGVPFGSYVYTDALGAKIGGIVPLPIPFAWLTIILSAIGITNMVKVQRVWAVLIVPLLTLLLDLLIQPAGTHILNYWLWLEEGLFYGAPTNNFISRFLITLAITIVTFILCGRKLSQSQLLPSLPALIYFLNILLFTMVDLVNGYSIAALLGGVFLIAYSFRHFPEFITIYNQWQTLQADVQKYYTERAK